MVTIYELLEVNEDASKEEIEQAYNKLVLEFRQDPHFDEKTNKENEMILNKIKIAYEILSNDAKRKKYDADLAKKRAENLIANVVTKDEISDEQSTENDSIINKQNISGQSTQQHNTQKNIENNQVLQNQEIQSNQIQQKQVYKKVQSNQNELNQDMLTDKEKKDIRKAAKKEFSQNLKKVKQAEEEYNDAYNKAYNDYLRKMGYQVKEPWTFKRVKRVALTIVIIVLVCVIMWCIPPVRKFLKSIYYQNFIIKAIVDLIRIIFESIIGIFK